MFLQQIINGLTVGSIYSLLALGYSMIFGVLSFINFAHGDVAVVGGFITWFMATKFGLDFIPSSIIGILAAIIIGIAIEFIGYRPIRRAPKLSAVIVSLGFSFILATAIQVIWGTESQSMPTFVEAKFYSIMDGIVINSTQLWVLIIGLVLMALLALLVNKTKIGMAMRAVALDQPTSGLMGINVNRTISFTFALGSALGAVSAILMASYYSVIYPTMGAVIGTKAFAAVVLGGAGSIPGAMIGGLIIGIIESLAGTIMSSQLREVTAFIVLIIVLIVKPSGLFGKDVAKE